MGLDLSELTPAPWMAKTCQDKSCWHVFDAKGKYVVACQNQKTAEEIALARNAFDVMMRRRWNPSLNGDGSWGVVMMITLGSAYRAGTFDRHVSRYPDPFTALVEADRWYKEKIEAADGHEA